MIYVNALGINNVSGANASEVFENVILKNEAVSLERGLLSGRRTQTMPVSAELPTIPRGLEHFESRNNRLLLHAYNQIAGVVEPLLKRHGHARVAIVLGTSTSGIQNTEASFVGQPEGPRSPEFNYYLQEASSPSDFLAAHLGVTGIHYTVSTACTSSAKSFIEGWRLLNAGLCEAVIVGGVDTLSSLTLDGFDCLDSLAEKRTNPFSRNRNGINIGEGAAIFVLSKEPAEIAFLGYGESSDAYHLSSPDPEGTGAEIALRGALKCAGLAPADIGYINLHGTGTEKNDFMEGGVVHRIFGGDVPVSSTKPFLGHTLGASAAQEAAICYLSLRDERRLLPAHLWDGEPDDQIPRLNFARAGDVWKKPVFMSNSFAFGGNNASLIFARSPA